MSVQVHIDRDECIRCGNCRLTCEAFFEENPADGLSQVVEEYRMDDKPGEGVAPADLEDCVREAAAGCPVGIIQVKSSE